MAKKQAAKITDTIDMLRPYLERALKDEDFRNDLKDALSAARELYGPISKGNGVGGGAKVIATDKKTQEQIRRAVDDLLSAKDTLKGKKRKGKAGRKMLLLAGVVAGVLVSRSLSGGVETTTSLVTTTATLTTTLTTSTTTPSTTTSTTPTTPATLPEGVVLRRGAKGAEVRQLQEALVALGYSTAVDGKFGPATAQAVKSFQASSGLTDDGVVGPATLTALSAAIDGT